jgi:expansin (peptidoglycan-binding protein)
MAKFTSLLLIATMAIASLTSAAPISPAATAEANPSTVVAAASASSDDISAFSTSVMFSGKATWFTDSYGSCNEKWDGNVEPIVALNAHQMGDQGWGNPACGHKVRITNKDNKNTVEARVVDKCPGDECAWGSLDLSPAAFKQLGHLDAGVLDIEWHYI